MNKLHSTTQNTPHAMSQHFTSLGLPPTRFRSDPLAAKFSQGACRLQPTPFEPNPVITVVRLVWSCPVWGAMPPPPKFGVLVVCLALTSFKRKLASHSLFFYLRHGEGCGIFLPCPKVCKRNWYEVSKFSGGGTENGWLPCGFPFNQPFRLLDP